MPHIPELVLQLLQGVALTTGVAVLHLRPPSEARPNQMSQRIERELRTQLIHVVRLLGTRAHHAQVAPEDVDDLRKLVEVGPAEQAAEWSDSRILLGGPPVDPF